MQQLMTHFELKSMRKAIGASLLRMAELFGISGEGGVSRLRKIENGSEDFPLVMQRLAKYMQQGVGMSAMDELLPRYLICDDLSGDMDAEWVFHTRYPRFMAIISPLPISGCTSIRISDYEWLVFGLWIDEPVGDADEAAAIDEAASLFIKHIKDLESM